MTRNSPVQIAFDPAKARAWLRTTGETAVIDFVDEPEWGTEGGVNDRYGTELTDLMSVMPHSVLDEHGCSLSVDSIHDATYYYLRVHVRLPDGITIASRTYDVMGLLPDVDRDYRDGVLHVGDVAMADPDGDESADEKPVAVEADEDQADEDDGEWPLAQLDRLVYVLNEIVDIANATIETFYQSLLWLADSRGWYLGEAPYLGTSPEGKAKEALEAEVAVLRSAAKAAVGDRDAMRGLLPSHILPARYR